MPCSSFMGGSLLCLCKSLQRPASIKRWKILMKGTFHNLSSSHYFLSPFFLLWETKHPSAFVPNSLPKYVSQQFLTKSVLPFRAHHHLVAKTVRKLWNFFPLNFHRMEHEEITVSPLCDQVQSCRGSQTVPELLFADSRYNQAVLATLSPQLFNTLSWSRHKISPTQSMSWAFRKFKYEASAK